MFRKIILLSALITFGFTSLSNASDEKGEDQTAPTLFPRGEGLRVFSGLPPFKPVNELKEFSEENQNRIKGLAQSFTTLRGYVQDLISDRAESYPSAHSKEHLKSAYSPVPEIKKYNLWIQQLSELQNTCLYFLMNSDYGFFDELIEKVDASSKRERLKHENDLLIFAEGTHLHCYLICPPPKKEESSLQEIRKFKRQIEKRIDDHYWIATDLPKSIYNGIKSEESYGNFVGELEKTQGHFRLLGEALKIAMNNGKALFGTESPFSALARDMGLSSDLYDRFKQMRMERIFEYEMPPVEFAEREPAKSSKAVSHMKKQLEVAEILMNLGSEFSEIFSAINKDKVSYWHRQLELNPSADLDSLEQQPISHSEPMDEAGNEDR
ncbi:MAG: hypothetical protein FJX71_04200 [Alphaproteobacteria bacterium]|nr:hypothetical protein [Alphaproteobacteria bacterium]